MGMRLISILRALASQNWSATLLTDHDVKENVLKGEGKPRQSECYFYGGNAIAFQLSSPLKDREEALNFKARNFRHVGSEWLLEVHSYKCCKSVCESTERPVFCVYALWVLWTLVNPENALNFAPDRFGWITTIVISSFFQTSQCS